jgi:4-cresol dehydrogenase (hydroxylating)
MSEAVVQNLAAILGNDGAFGISDARGAEYRQRFAILARKQPDLVAVVLPDSAETLQRVVATLHTADLGVLYSPNAAGNGAWLSPGERPTVIVDTRRMNRILEVNTQYAYALIEPGVSFRDLQTHFAGEHLAFWVDCDRNSDHSITGSVISKQFGYTAYAEHALMQCGAELVTRNGQLLRTGMGAIPDSKTWQIYKYALGPYLDGLAQQSDLALVSKLGLWIMGAPPGFQPFMARLSGGESLRDCVETLRPLLIGGVISSTVVLVPTEAVGQHGAALQWDLFGALYGLPKVVDLNWGVVRDALASTRGARLVEGAERDASPAWRVNLALLNGAIPHSPTAAADSRPEHYVIFTAPLEGELAVNLHDQARAIAVKNNIESKVELALLSRALRYRVTLQMNAVAEPSAERISETARTLVATLTAQGYHLVDHSFSLSEVAAHAPARTGFEALLRRVRSAVALGCTA